MNLTKQLRDRALKASIGHSLWSIFDVLLYPVIYVLFTPFLLAQLGKDGYGLFVLVNTIVVFMQVFNFGLGVNTLKNVATAIGKGRVSAAIPLLQSNITLGLLITFVCVVASLVLAQLTGHFHWFGIPQPLQRTAFFAIGAAGIIGGQKTIEQVLANGLIAFEKIGVASRYNSVIRIGNLLCTLLLVYARANLALVFAVTIMLYTGGLFYLYRRLKVHTGNIPFAARPDWQFIRRELLYSKWIWIQSVCVIIAFQFDKFLIGYWYGIEDFSYYSIVSTVFNHLHLALIALAPWAMPQIAKQFAAGQDIRDYYTNCRSLIHIVSFCGMLLLAVLHEPAFGLWLGKHLLVHIDGYVHLFMCFELVLTFTIAPYFFLNATGSEKLASLNTFIYTFLSVAGLFCGHYVFHSIMAIIACTTAFLFAGMIVQQWIIAKVLQRRPLQEIAVLLLPTLLLILFILSEGHSMPLRIFLLVSGLAAFYYVYFMLYPFRLTMLQAQKQYSHG